MVYQKHNWKPGKDGGTSVNHVSLNEMEDGIDLAINQGLTVGTVTTGAVAGAAVTGEPGAKKLDLVLPQNTEFGWLHAGHINNGGTAYEALHLHYSPDGKTVLGGYGNPVYRPVSAGTSLRDPHIQRINDTWVMCYTPNNGKSETLELAQSDDLVNWTLIATVNVAAATNQDWAWAPELVFDNGSWYMFYTAVNIAVSPATHEIWRVRALNPALTSWGELTKVTWSVHPGGNPIDPAFIKVGNTWQIYYGLDGVIRRATAATVAGTWTTDKTGDWAGWVSGAVDGTNHRGYEGPELVWAEPGRLRIYLDRYLVSPVNKAMGYIYSDSTDNGQTWTAPKKVLKGPGFPQDGEVRHGTWYKINTALEHEQVLGATLGTGQKIWHAELTGSGTITGGQKWAGPFTRDTLASSNALDFTELNNGTNGLTNRQVRILRTGIYAVDFLVQAGVALGGWMAVKGPGETPNYATNDLAAGAPAWSVSASNLRLEAGTVLEFYFQPANTATLSDLRVRLTKVV